MVPISLVATASLSHDEIPSSSTLLNVLRNLGGAFGIAIIATLLDNAMVSAGRAAAGPEARLATIEMKLSFMRAGKGSLRCTAKCLHSTSRLAFCEGEVRDASGNLIATASSTMQYVAGSGGKTQAPATPA